MGLVVEDGTGIPGANSYVALADADAHFSGLGHSTWSEASEGSKEYALISASEYADFYEYPGQLRNLEQGLKWPRFGAKGRDGRVVSGIPMALRTAVLELASDYIQKPNQSKEPRTIVKEKVGPVELVYARKGKQPSFVFRLLMKIGATPIVTEMSRG